MPLPHSTEARPYCRAAQRRLADAKVLLEHSKANGAHTTGAMYMAGYAVECVLKALIVDGTSQTRRSETISAFRGASGHSYDVLLHRYRMVKGPVIPNETHLHLSRINTWSTDLRYDPRLEPYQVAAGFIESVDAIMKWAEMRF